jgi:short-subunit dehydrogenase
VPGDSDAADKLLYLNLASPMRLTRVLAPAMAEKGGTCIINISSVAGTHA